jgi:hypothetical protein
VDDTPTPGASEEGFYSSPSYGYTVAYDPGTWQEAANQTSPGSYGPTDYLALGGTSGEVLAEFVAFGIPEPTLVPQYLDWLILNFEQGPEYSNIVIRTDDAGNELRGGDERHGFLVIDLDFTNSRGQQFARTFHLEAWQMPTVGGFLVMIYQTPRDAYESDAPVREALVQGLTLPQ